MVSPNYLLTSPFCFPLGTLPSHHIKLTFLFHTPSFLPTPPIHVCAQNCTFMPLIIPLQVYPVSLFSGFPSTDYL